MANRIKVKRGTDADRLVSNLETNEISYSTGGDDGGRPRRFWVTDTSATANEANNSDVLIGPFEFVGSSKIQVDADYTTGRVQFSLIADQTFNPTRTLLLNGAGYTNAYTTGTNSSTQLVTTEAWPSDNPVLEAKEVYGSTVNHKITLKNDAGANPVKADYAEVVMEGTTTTFDQSELQAYDSIVWDDLTTTAQKNFNTVVSTPATFAATVSNGTVTTMTGDSKTYTLNIKPAASSGFPDRSTSTAASWGWKVAWFPAQNEDWDEDNLPTVAEINQGIANGGGVTIAYRPWAMNNGQGVKCTFTTPSGQGNNWAIYFVTTTDSATGGFPTAVDSYGWEPYAYSSSNLGQTLTEVTNRGAAKVRDVAAGATQIGSIGQNGMAKFYRIWKLSPPGGYTGGQTQTVYLRDKD